MTDTRVGTDGLVRPVWAADDGDMQAYYDTEWGVPVTNEPTSRVPLSVSASKVFRPGSPGAPS